ncbi:MAG: MFS transporter [Oceanococcus sp.]
MSSQFGLVGKKRFGPFFWTQFFGAFNDNIYKNALIILIAFQLGNAETTNTLINLAAALFILPFFLFSASAGQIADKYEKSQLIRGIKLLEIGIMCAAAVALANRNVTALMTLLFLMGAQSSLFGPVKYGILPQHLKPEELVGGNGMVEMGTFVAILIGTLLGGLLIGLPQSGPAWVGATVIGVAIMGYTASRLVPRAEAAAPDLKINWNPLTATWANLKFLSGDRTVFLACLGVSWFWFFGAIYLTQLPNYTRLSLGGNEQVVTLLLTLFSLGIGVGSLACEKLSEGKVEIGLVPFGSLGLTIFALDMFFAVEPVLAQELMGASAFLSQAGSLRVMMDVVLIGAFGGLYIVPLYALIQSRAAPAHRSRVIAGNNILNAFLMVLSALVAAVSLGAGLSIPQLFLVTAIMNLAVAAFIYSLVPEFLVRFVAYILVHTIYRMKKTGLERIPDEGPALLVCNHVSFVDALILGGCVRRPVRFVMYHKIFEVPVLSWFFRTVKAIPIAPAKENEALLARAMDDIQNELDAGQLVCIFPEGGLTADGEIADFRSGIERILQRRAVPVVPMALSGLWGSFFSRARGSAMASLPRRFWSRILLDVADPVPPEQANAASLRAAVASLRSKA